MPVVAAYEMLAYSLHSILAPRSHFTSIYFLIFLFAYSVSKLVFDAGEGRENLHKIVKINQ